MTRPRPAGHVRSIRCLLAVFPVLAACGSTDLPASAFVRDSAGVQIVENTAPALETPWRLAPEPILSIGVVEGEEAYQFSDIGNAFRLSDGRIVVANRRNPADIRVYDASGRHLRTLGRPGAGPGEFQSIFFADHNGDTIRAYDPGTARITRYTADGGLIDVAQLADIGSDAAGRYILFPGARDGGLLGRSNAPLVDPTTSSPRTGYSEVVFTESSGVVRTPPLRIADGEYDETTNKMLLFSPRTATTAVDSLLYVGTGADFTIDVYGPDLTLRRRIRRTHDALPVGREEAAAYVDERLAIVANPGVRSLMEQSFASSRARSHMPAHDATILVDSQENVWVLGYKAPGQTGEAWSVFDNEGVYLGDVSVPPSLQILDIEDEYILAVDRDELGVQRLQVLRLLKP